MSRYRQQREQQSPQDGGQTQSSSAPTSRASSQLMMRERVGEVLRRAEGMGAQPAAVSPDNNCPL